MLRAIQVGTVAALALSFYALWQTRPLDEPAPTLEAYPARNVCVSADPHGCRDEAWERVVTVYPWTCCRSCAVDVDGGWVRP